ncbi:MAG: type I-U CRISPR-associated helicase/endonuclease Cas3 [Solirubrobacteraceae bacterium]|nr:type I-U CRISPR-associated helicase/endonuclease Cas3 [Solirubrobacteraceae bacterium]
MTLADRFRAFFAAANQGAEPYPWQIALMERIAVGGVWPSAISAPTGSGKSSVVDVHVFLVSERERQRRAESPSIARPPRRLVLVAPRRVLVDDQHERAVRLAKRLSDAKEGPLAEARHALQGLTTAVELRDMPLGVARLRGGVRLDRTWRLDPGQCQVICATPQMWGSRLLLRGFRSSRRARNLESGLLAHDVAVVIDEAHLHERLVDTSMRVSATADRIAGLQIVAMSATRPAADGQTLTREDLENDELAKRVRAPKTIVLDEVDDWARDRVPRMVAVATQLRARHPDEGTVGVFVNTVASALDTAAALKSDGGSTVRVVCGSMRPADLARIRREHPGLLEARGNPDVDFLVATQSLEVGVDLDLGAIVSELAPASSLAQRLGRLNRSGSRSQSTFHIVTPAGLAEADPDELAKAFAPYDAQDLKRTLGWLDELGDDGSPERIGNLALPGARGVPPAPAITAIEIETLAMTSPTLAADPDVGFYVEDPVDSEQYSVQVAAREHLDLPDEVVRQALLAAPPRAHELAELSNRKVLDEILRTCPDAWVIRSEAGSRDAFPLRALPRHHGDVRLRSDDVLVIPAGSPVAVEGALGVTRGKGEPLDDVVAERLDDGVADVLLCLSGEASELVSALVESDPVLGTRAVRRSLAEIVESIGEVALAKRLGKHRFLSDLSIAWCMDAEDPDGPGLLVVVDAGREGRATNGAVSESPVTVDDHCEDAARRMAEIVAALDGLVDRDADALVAAARLHDEGKRHPRFQLRMGRRPEDPELAKPAPGHVPDRGDGWRHEQLSAAVAHARGHDTLATTLVAAHHGLGRPLFDRDDVAARDRWPECPGDVVSSLSALFGPYGHFESGRDQLHREHGVHRIAFLEALVRCADMQVSREVEN